MKFILKIICLLVISGCAASDEPPLLPNGEEVIKCVHKHDPDIKFYYIKRNMVEFTQNNVLQFQFIDLNGKEIFLNVYEIENYICEEVSEEIQ